MRDSKEFYQIAFKGFLMGAADIVPGVSGGTVAFILGIYDRLVNAIASIDLNLFKLLKKREFKKALSHIDFFFLLPLLSGIFLALILLARLMHFLLVNHPTPTWALFFGLILSSIFYLKKEIDNFFEIKNLMMTIFGTIIAFFIVGAVPTTTPTDYVTIFFSGAIAIIAMILPGISGSFILLLIGKYIFITNALKNPFLENHLLILITFALGCFIGITSFSRALKFLLSKYNSFTLCFLTGFMIGSLRKIWPWKNTLESMIVGGNEVILREENILPVSFDFTFFLSLTLFLFGFAVVFFLESKTKKLPN